MKLKKISKMDNHENKIMDCKLPLIIAGPCSVENYDTMSSTVKFLKGLGVEYIRGGIFKPRTSPHSFQGLGYEGVDILKRIKSEYDVKIVSEVMDLEEIENLYDLVDVFQVGSRNMYNYNLLKELGKTTKPVLLKRGISATIKEWLCAAEYISVGGNNQIILCERGIRTFETATRNTIDISCIPIIKEKCNYKIIIDPSHGSGRRDLIKSLSLAGIAAGCDGLMIEVHPDPDKALSDSYQSIDFEEFKNTYKSVQKLYEFNKKEAL